MDYSDTTPRLCWLHEDNDEHWVTDDDLVGLIPLVDGQLRPDISPAQVARDCAEALGEPARIIDLRTRR